MGEILLQSCGLMSQNAKQWVTKHEMWSRKVGVGHCRKHAETETLKHLKAGKVHRASSHQREAETEYRSARANLIDIQRFQFREIPSISPSVIIRYVTGACGLRQGVVGWGVFIERAD